MYNKIANSHSSLKRGQVWCLECGHTENVSSANCLANGWPKCCGYTMTIDDPSTRTNSPTNPKLEGNS